MKITRIDVFPVRIPLKTAFRNSHLVRLSQDSIVVRVAADEGFMGLGDVDPDPGYSEESFAETLSTIRDQLTPSLVGMDPMNIAAALERMDRLLPGRLDAKAAIEMALFDLKGKALGIPVHSLLGGVLREEIALNAWIGILSPEEAAQEARGWLEAGFRSAKIKVGSGIEQDRDRVSAVRAAVGRKMALRVDANEAYTVEDAIRLGRLLSSLDISLLEQPVSRHDLDGMAKVRKAVEIPVMADEAILGPETLIDVIRKEAADIVKVKVMKQGGIFKTTHMIQMAEAAGLKCVIGHGFGLTINTLAEIHVAASCRNILEGCEFVGPLKMQKDVVKNQLRMDGGKVKVPHDRGLGAEIDEGKLKECVLA
ncbi:MAG TPA: enolase C-terminal domain-like protein [Terriglobales bacterium]|nr:enolase C-terminal domain-like protein [Terriglobales bacterium]